MRWARWLLSYVFVLCGNRLIQREVSAFCVAMEAEDLSLAEEILASLQQEFGDRGILHPELSRMEGWLEESWAEKIAETAERMEAEGLSAEEATEEEVN